MAPAEHQVLEAVLELPQERERHREDEQEDQRVAAQGAQLAAAGRCRSRTADELLEQPQAGEEDGSQGEGGEEVEDHALGQGAEVHQPVADDGHAEGQGEHRVARDADRVQPVPGEKEPDDVDRAAEEADRETPGRPRA